MSASKVKSFAQSFRDNNYNIENQTVSSYRVSSDFFYKTKNQENNKDKDIRSITMTPPLSPNANSTKAKIKVEKSIKGIKKVVDKYSNLKMSMQSLGNISQKEKEIENKKDDEIEKLTECIEDCKNRNEELKYLVNEKLEDRNELDREQREIAEYCNDLKRKFNNIEKTVEEYEQTISKLKQTINTIQEGYDKKFELIENDTKKLQTRFEDRSKIVKSQQTTIRDYELKNDFILREIQEEKNLHNERQTIRKVKFDELEKKYMVIQKKISNFQMKEDLRDIEIKSNKKKLKEQKNCSENIEHELEQYDKRNQELRNNIDEITNQIKMMQTTSRPFDRNNRTNKSKGSSDKNLNNRNKN